jgi:hypothetical protein
MVKSKAMANLQFNPGVCHKHREMFVDFLVALGVKDWRLMEMVRVRFVLEASRRFSNDEMWAYFTTCCVGCEHEAWSLELIGRIIADRVPDWEAVIKAEEKTR